MSAADMLALDAHSVPKPSWSQEDDDRKPQEATVRPLQEGESTDVPDQAHPSQLRAEDDQSLRSVDPAGKNTYQLVSVVSHYGSTTHSGHYVSEVYNVGRSR